MENATTLDYVTLVIVDEFTTSTGFVGDIPGQLALASRMGLAALSLVLNTFIQAVQVKVKCYRDTKYMFGFVLSSADWLMGASIVCRSYYYLAYIEPIPDTFYVVLLASVLSKQCAVIGVGIDRLLALVVYPLQYKYKVTVSRYTAIITIFTILNIGSAVFLVRNIELLYHPIRTIVTLMIILSGSIVLYIINSVSLARSLGKVKLSSLSARKRRLQQSRRIIVAFTMILILEMSQVPETIFAVYLTTKPIHLRYGVKDVLIYNWLYNIRVLVLCCDPLIYWWQFLFREVRNRSRSTRSWRTGATPTISRSMSG